MLKANTHKNKNWSAIVLALIGAIFLPATLQAQESALGDAGFETLSNRATADLVPESLLSGPYHRLQPEAVPYLFDYIFTIDSDFGAFTAHDTEDLAKQINEVNAIAALEKMKSTKTFSDAAKKAALRPLGTAKDLVTKPVKTTGAVLKGVVETGKNVAGGVNNGVKSVAKGEKQQKTQFEDGAIAELSGYSKIKRALAATLDVDPYTRNEILQKELEDVSRTAFAGGLGVGVAATTLTGGLAKVAVQVSSTSEGLQSALADMSPAEIRAMNQKKLKELGCSDKVIEAFQNHLALLPTQRAYLVHAASMLEGASGMDSFFQLACQVRDEDETDRLLKSARMLAALPARGIGVTEIVDCGGLVAGITTDDRILVPLPGRTIAWTPFAQQIVDAVASFQSSGKTIAQSELLISGEVTAAAQDAFEAGGLTLNSPQ